MPDIETIDLRFSGTYSLAASVALSTRAAFVADMQDTPDGGRALELAFPLEGFGSMVAVSVEQRDKRVRATVVANPDTAPPDLIRTSLERMLSLDTDGVAFEAIGGPDPVVAELQRERPGVRPILFASPYEAAARAIIGHQLHPRQAAAIQGRIAGEYGVTAEFGSRRVPAFPAPARLAGLDPVQGLAARKVEQLRALGTAAAGGRLDSARLRAMDRDAAMADLQQLAGIGPFSAELIMLRGVGDADAFPRTELRLHRAMAAAYRLGEDPSIETLEGIAERWRPYRTWVGLLLRNR